MIGKGGGRDVCRIWGAFLNTYRGFSFKKEEIINVGVECIKAVPPGEVNTFVLAKYDFF